MMIEFADPKEWWLELSPTIHAEAAQESRPCSTATSRYRAYLNGVCLHGFLNWLQEDVSEALPWLPPAGLAATWEVVNGTAVQVGTTRFVLIPSEAIDDGELDVPQEWVDIPGWVGDYYLAVQVQLEQGWLRIWGYTTHQELKSKGDYDSDDRTYSLAAEQLTRDLNALWVTVRLCETAQTRSAIVSLPELSDSQAENLIQRLGHEVMFPRLAIPFTLWGALLEQETWRHQLWQRRTGGREAPGTVVRLREWWQENFSTSWQAIADVIQPQPWATAWRSEATDPPLEFAVSRAKVLEFGSQPGVASLALVLSLCSLTESRTVVRLQIGSVGGQPLLPHPVQVRLLDAAGNEVGQASAAVTETMQLQFEVELGERFSIEVSSGEKTITEEFEL